MLTKPRRLVDERNEIRATCKRLVRYIHENDLHEGDRVPPQEILRRQFGIRHDTLTAAMRTLVQYEVVHRKPKVGTVVVNRDAVIPGLWSVGLLAYDYQERIDNMYIVSLLWALEGYLAREGCTWQTYYRTVNRGLEPNRIADFPGVESDIAMGRIDAVISPNEVLGEDLKGLEKFGVAACAIAFVDRVGANISAACIDLSTLADQGMDVLKQAGCRRVGVVGPVRIIGNPQAALRIRMHQAIQRAGMSGEMWLVSPTKGNHSAIASGRAVALRLLELPPDQRPDGLLVMTDMLTLGLTETLAGSNYRPVITAMTNLQITMLFSLPVVRFELDLDRLARTAVTQTMRQLHNPQASKEIVLVTPERGEPILGQCNPLEEPVVYDLF